MFKNLTQNVKACASKFAHASFLEFMLLAAETQEGATIDTGRGDIPRPLAEAETTARLPLATGPARLGIHKKGS